MGTAHRIDAVRLNQIRILHLQFIRHSTPNPGPLLMAVNTDNLSLLSIQIEASVFRPFLELQKTHAEPGLVCIDDCLSVYNFRDCRVQIGIVHIPQVRIVNRLCSHLYISPEACLDFCLFRYRNNGLTLPVKHFRLNSVGFPLIRAVQDIYTILYHTAVFGKPWRGDKHPLYMHRVCDCHIHVPDDAAKQAVIHIASFRRQLGLPFGVDSDSKYVLSSIRVHFIRNVHREPRIRALMVCQQIAVQIHIRDGGNALKIHAYMFAGIMLRQREMPAVP